jgi:hypothetical protein
MPHLCELYPVICHTTEEKAQKNLSQGSQRVPVYGAIDEEKVYIVSLKKELFWL